MIFAVKYVGGYIMSEFIIREESFKLGILEKVPLPQVNECFLLYQVGTGENNSFVISHGATYSTTQVRHGHYNKKVTLSLNEKTLQQNYQVAMKDQDFHFNVKVEVSYFLQDARAYFFQGQMEDDDVKRVIKEAVRMQDGIWDVQQTLNVRNDLEDKIEQKLKRFTGIKFKTPKVDVAPDEMAEKIIDSNRDKTVEIHQNKNEADKEIAYNEQGGRIADSKKELKEKQIEDLANMVQNFGSMAPIMEEYFNGNINGTELYEYISRAKNDKMNLLHTAVSNDMLSDKEIVEKLNDILGTNGILQTNEYKQLSDNSESKNKIEIKSEEKQADEVEDFSPADGDYI